MKKPPLFAALLLGWLAADCQQRVFELPMTPAEADGLKAYTVYDPHSAGILLTLAYRNKIDRYMIARTDSLVGPPVRITGTQLYDKATRSASFLSFDNYLGYTLVKGGIEESVADKGLSKICFFRTGYNDNSLLRTDSILIPAGEHLFASFYQHDHFYALSVVKGSGTVRIYHRRPEGGTDVSQKEIPVKDWGKTAHLQRLTERRRVDDLTDLVESLGMTLRDSSYTPPLPLTLAKCKLYVQTGKVYISFDNVHLQSRVIEMPLDSRPCRILEFSPVPYYHNEIPPGFSNGNSFIIDSTLVVASIIHLKLYLAFYDLSTGQLKASYVPDEKGNPGFPHSPVFQVGDFWRKDAVHTIPMGEMAKNSFDFWMLGISGHRSGDHQFELEIGTIYNRETFGKFMLALGSMGGGAAVGSGHLIMMGPGFSRKNTMFFKSQFRSDTFAPLSYKELQDKSEIIDTFVDSQKIPRKEITVLQQLDGNYWLGYYQSEDQQYVVYKF